MACGALSDRTAQGPGVVARIVSGEGARGQLASEHGPRGPPLWALLGTSEEQGPHVWVLEGSLPA